MKRCCPNCFGDGHLRRAVFPSIPAKSKSIGTCDYCGSTLQELVLPVELRDLFELVIGIYTAHESGRPLVDWLSADWSMFDHPKMDALLAKRLLADILEDWDIVERRFVPLAEDRRSLVRWQEFREELMYRNRYFPKALPDLDRLASLLGYLMVIQGQTAPVLFRARLQHGRVPYGIEQMGPPPPELARSARASPAGIPYLYLASDHRTAISELRPQTGDLACVAEVSIPADLKLVDIRNPRKTVSPFAFSEEEEDVALLRNDLAFLVKLGDELTKPVLHQLADIDYLPSQYVCEFIKNCGFDGVIYRSAVGEGSNYALFDPAKATFKRIFQYCVSRVSVDLDATQVQ